MLGKMNKGLDRMLSSPGMSFMVANNTGGNPYQAYDQALRRQRVLAEQNKSVSPDVPQMSAGPTFNWQTGENQPAPQMTLSQSVLERPQQSAGFDSDKFNESLWRMQNAGRVQKQPMSLPSPVRVGRNQPMQVNRLGSTKPSLFSGFQRY